MRNQAKCLLLVSLIFLSACDQLRALNKSEPDQAPAPVAEPEPVPQVDIVADTLSRGAVVFAGGKQNLRFPPELTVTEMLSDEGLILSGTLVDPVSSGQTGGLAFPVSTEIEVAASGKLIRIHAVVSGEVSGDAFLAYSTNEVGNSGWMPFQVTTEDTAVALEYTVPVMNAGQGDFIDIDPKGNSLTIKAIAVEIVG